MAGAGWQKCALARRGRNEASLTRARFVVANLCHPGAFWRLGDLLRGKGR